MYLHSRPDLLERKQNPICLSFSRLREGLDLQFPSFDQFPTIAWPDLLSELSDVLNEDNRVLPCCKMTSLFMFLPIYNILGNSTFCPPAWDIHNLCVTRYQLLLLTCCFLNLAHLLERLMLQNRPWMRWGLIMSLLAILLSFLWYSCRSVSAQNGRE